MIVEIDELTRQMTNLKSKVRRRRKKLEKIFDPLERQRIENEIGLLKRKIQKLQIEEIKLSMSIIEVTANLSKGKSEDRIDWSKAGRA
jgi:hypothetical protein